MSEATSPLPIIGWKACTEEFFLDGMPISQETAFYLWQSGTGAIFLENAAKRLREIANDLFDDSDCSPAGPVS